LCHGPPNARKRHIVERAPILTRTDVSQVPAYALEQALKKSVKMGAEPDCTRAVRIRRSWVAMKAKAFGEIDEETAAAAAAFEPTSVPQGETEQSAEVLEEMRAGAPLASIPKVLEDYSMESAMKQLPYDSFDHDNFYRTILGQNCEMVIGFVPLPVGVAGPLLLDGKHIQVRSYRHWYPTVVRVCCRRGTFEPST